MAALDSSSKRTLVVQRSASGKIKVMGTWKLSPVDGPVLMVPHAYSVPGGPCGIEFDDIEFVDELRNYRDRTLGQPDLTVITYSRGQGN